MSLVASNVHSLHECLTFISLHLCLQFACVACCCLWELLYLPLSPLSVVLKNHCSSHFLYAACLSLGVQSLHRDNYIQYIYMKTSRLAENVI